MLVVQPTAFCNIDCSYCYLPDRTNKRRMSIETFARVLDNVCASGVFPDGFTINWHAGEPLTVPLTFYEEASELIGEAVRRHGIQILQSLQTNATRIDDAWCRLFTRAGIYVGVSIDGPREFHDTNRRTRSGAGTFAAVMSGVRMLQAHSIRFSAICVLTRSHLSAPEAIHRFFVENGFTSVTFNIDEIEGGHTSSSMAGEAVAEEFKGFLDRFLSLNDRATAGLHLPNLSLNVLSEHAEMANHQVEPWRLITVGLDGDTTTFSPELLGQRSSEYGDFVLGNLGRETIGEMASRDPFLRLRDDIRDGVELCRRQCGYFRFCGGGSPVNKFFESGTFRSTETVHCRLMKKAVCEVNLARASRVLESVAGRLPKPLGASDSAIAEQSHSTEGCSADMAEHP